MHFMNQLTRKQSHRMGYCPTNVALIYKINTHGAYNVSIGDWFRSVEWPGSFANPSMCVCVCVFAVF